MHLLKFTVIYVALRNGCLLKHLQMLHIYLISVNLLVKLQDQNPVQIIQETIFLKLKVLIEFSSLIYFII